MQNIGFLFIILPALKKFYKGKDLTDACERHRKHFNTNPYMAPSVIGTTLALEEQKANKSVEDIDIADFKMMILPPYAAMGDALFWGGIRPLAAVTALFFAAKGSIIAPFVFLTLFNMPHLWFRFSGIIRGYRQGIEVIDIIYNFQLPDWAIRAKEATVVMLGGFFAYIVSSVLKGSNTQPLWGLIFIPIFIILVLLFRKGLMVTPVIYILSTTIIVTCWIYI